MAPPSRVPLSTGLEVLERGAPHRGGRDSPREVVEHVLGHAHHDHMVCEVCGRIEEFQDDEIEALQRKNAYRLGFVMTGHLTAPLGICPTCVKEPRRRARWRRSSASSAARSGSPTICGLTPSSTGRARCALSRVSRPDLALEDASTVGGRATAKPPARPIVAGLSPGRGRCSEARSRRPRPRRPGSARRR